MTTNTGENTGYTNTGDHTGYTTTGDARVAGAQWAERTAEDHQRDVHVIGRDESETRRRDRIRWSAIWAGLAVAVATYLLLQLLLIALGVVELGGGDTNDAVWSAIAALAAFLLGGVTAGASAMWRDSDDGLLHGIVLWAVGVVVVAVLAGIGSSVALGALDTSDVFDDVTSAEEADVDAANDTAQEASGRAVAGIVAALAAAAIGGAVGSKLWPKVVRDRTTVGATTVGTTRTRS